MPSALARAWAGTFQITFTTGEQTPMALTVVQLEAHLGRFLRQLLTHMDPEVAQRVLEPLAAGLANAGRQYVLNGTLGTQADRVEAMTTMAKAIYQATQGADPNDGGRGQHGFENHWLPSKQRGE